ncbi:hypothetical protein BGZ80_003075, partial [Entomortierella chlamydospora]
MIRLSLLARGQIQIQGRHCLSLPSFTSSPSPVHRVSSFSPRTFSTSWRTLFPEGTKTGDNTRSSDPFRVAVIGSGPGGFYAAHRILKHLPQASIDMYEALPVPHGLVRFGVAPDHPEVKNVMHTFDEVAQNPNFTFIGNTSVGTFTDSSSKADLEISDLRPHYDAILLAYGAHEDRLLNVPNEQSLKGVMAARSFVGFYNGLPSEQNLEIDLSRTDTAVVIGQGNVALDVARILLTPLEELKKTDLTEKMVKILEKSRVKHVYVVGRRGPLEVAFTSKELREMLNLPDTTFHMDGDLLASEMERAGKTLDRPRKRLMGLLEKGIKESKPDQPKSFSLLFLRSPVGFQGGQDADSEHLKAIELGINRLEGENNNRKAVPTGEKETLDCGLVFRSIGYKSVGIKDVPFDERKGVIPNMDGKVLDADQKFVSALPCYWTTGQPMLNGGNGNGVETPTHKQGAKPILDLLHSRGHKTVSYQDWKKIEQREFELGAKTGKPRE